VVTVTYEVDLPEVDAALVEQIAGLDQKYADGKHSTHASRWLMSPSGHLERDSEGSAGPFLRSFRCATLDITG
jgi:hypothetical protein